MRTAAAPTGRFAPLDGLRGFAVLLVFCVHAAGNAAHVALGRDLGATRYGALAGGAEHALFWLFRSHHGVFVFFVLSGFLIARMWWPRPSHGYGTFAWRRTLRIYPAFLLAFVASLAFAHASGTWAPPDLPRLAGNLVFLNGWPPAGVVPFNTVTWSLFYEMTFYLAFPLVAWAGARSGAPLLASAVGIGAPIVAVLAGVDPIVLCWSLLFAGAALAAGDALRERAARLPSWLVLTAYLAVTTTAMLDAMPPLAGIVAFGAAAVLLLAKCTVPDNALARLFATRPLRALGRVSYSFYLLHWMIVVLVARTVETARLSPLAATLAIFVAGFVLSWLAAHASWWIAERPYLRWAGDARATGETARPLAGIRRG